VKVYYLDGVKHGLCDKGMFSLMQLSKAVEEHEVRPEKLPETRSFGSYTYRRNHVLLPDGVDRDVLTTEFNIPELRSIYVLPTQEGSGVSLRICSSPYESPDQIREKYTLRSQDIQIRTDNSLTREFCRHVGDNSPTYVFDMDDQHGPVIIEYFSFHNEKPMIQEQVRGSDGRVLNTSQYDGESGELRKEQKRVRWE